MCSPILHFRKNSESFLISETRFFECPVGHIGSLTKGGWIFESHRLASLALERYNDFLIYCQETLHSAPGTCARYDTVHTHNWGLLHMVSKLAHVLQVVLGFRIWMLGRVWLSDWYARKAVWLAWGTCRWAFLLDWGIRTSFILPNLYSQYYESSPVIF